MSGNGILSKWSINARKVSNINMVIKYHSSYIFKRNFKPLNISPLKVAYLIFKVFNEILNEINSEGLFNFLMVQRNILLFN